MESINNYTKKTSKIVYKFLEFCLHNGVDYDRLISIKKNITIMVKENRNE